MNADDLEGMSRDQLVDEVKKLRQGIRAHRDSTGHGAVLAPSGIVVATAGAIGSTSYRSQLAVVPSWLHTVSPVARRADSPSPEKR